MLDGPGRPASVIEQARARRALFGRKDVVGTELKTAHWTTADPTRIIESQTTVVSVIDGDRLSAREQLEGLTAEVTLEKSTGMPSKTVVPVGPFSIEIVRVYLNGSF